MTNTAVVLLLVISASSSAISQVGEPDRGVDLPALQALAEKGDSSAQLALGIAHEEGRGVRQDDALAVGWYRKAAEAGNSEAQNHLGIMYMNGTGVNKDKEQAVHWYQVAAKQKNAPAMFNLGTAYYNGDGVGIDDIRAFAWFLLAQDSGSASARDAVQRAEKELRPGTIDSAIREIATMYLQGNILNRDDKEAIRWLGKAAKHGDVLAEVMLAGTLIQQTPPDYDGARKWCEAALAKRSAIAANCLGEIYRNGLGTAKNPAKALPLLRQAADAGIALAMIEAADMLANGEAGKTDRRQALFYLVRAMLLGDTNARSRAVVVRSQMSEKDWEKTKAEIVQRFPIDRVNVALKNIEASPH